MFVFMGVYVYGCMYGYVLYAFMYVWLCLCLSAISLVCWIGFEFVSRGVSLVHASFDFRYLYCLHGFIAFYLFYFRRYTPRRTFSHHGFSAAKTTLNLASKLLEKQGHPDAKKYIVWIKRGRPTLRTMAYLRKRFAQKNVVVLTGRIRRRKGGPMYLQLGFLLHKGYSRRSKSQYPFLKGKVDCCSQCKRLVTPC